MKAKVLPKEATGTSRPYNSMIRAHGAIKGIARLVVR
jgi:hypothetical protein